MQENDVKIEIEMSPAYQDEQTVWGGLRQYNNEHVPSDSDVTFAVFLRGTGETILGGVLAKAGRGWLHITSMWAAPSVRGSGYGTRLLAAAEEEARGP